MGKKRGWKFTGLFAMLCFLVLAVLAPRASEETQSETVMVSYLLAVVGDQCLFGEGTIKEKIKDTMRNAWNSAGEPETEAPFAGNTEAMQAETVRETEQNETAEDFVQVLYYSSASCESCAQAEEAIEALPQTVSINGTNYPVRIEKFSIAEGDAAEKLPGLFEAYQVPLKKQQVPIVFVGTSYLSGEKEICSRLGELIASEKAIETLADLADRDESPSTENFLDAVGIGSIITTGFLNGFNPCGLSMTLLFLSLLAAGSKKFLRYGLSFLAGKYIAYVGLGLAVSKAAAAIPESVFGVADRIINIILLVFCLILAVGNFLDFLNARKGAYGKIRVQLPRVLRRWNNNFLKRTVREEYGGLLILVVFAGSMVVSLGEFFCTGQIYLASILRWITQAGQSGVPIAVFCLYIVMMCLPALIIILLVAGGKSVLSISEKSLSNMPVIKLCNAVLFLIFAVLAVKMLL